MLLLAVDEVLGDFLAFPAATRELLPPRALPGAVLIRLVDLVQGRNTADQGGTDRLAVLTPLFRQNRLEVARAAVVERITRHLKGSEPLCPGQPALEAETHRRLAAGLLSPEGVIGGCAVAEALTRRSIRDVGRDVGRDAGETVGRGLRKAIIAITEQLADLPARLHYLAAMCGPDVSPAQGEEVAGCLEASLPGGAGLEALVLGTAKPAATKAALRGCAAALEAGGLPAPVRRRLAYRVEHLADEYACSGHLIPRLQALEPSIGRRAWRVAELVSSGLISDAGALTVVRQHLFDLLRQPGFNDELVALKSGPDGVSVDLQRFRAVIDQLHRTPEGSAATIAPAPSAPARMQTPAVQPEDMTIAQVGLGARAGFGDATMTVAQVRPRPSPAANFGPTPAANFGPSPAANFGPTPAATLPQAAVLDAPTVAYSPRSAPRAASVGDGRCPNCFAQMGAVEQCPECRYIDGTTPCSPILLMPGTCLVNRYRTGKLLGQGGFGATYLGWDERLQIRVAVKEYFPTNLVSRAPSGGGMTPYTAEHAKGFAKGIVKFLAEARTLAKLRETREIVAVQDYFEDNATAYLVMELLQGRTMKQFIIEQGGKIEYKLALSILMPIMKALQAVHEQGMVHRDISPDNIFMPSSGGAKLLDFGAARCAVGEAGAGLTVILKPGFAPPEQYFADSRQGPWTDVYALAATLYCAIVGKAPMDSTRRLQEDGLQLPSALGVALAPEVERVLALALSPRRKDRYQSMSEMIDALVKVGSLAQIAE